MKAVVYHGVGDIRLDNIPEPTLQASTDAIVRITASAIRGTVLGHEAVGVVEQIGKDVRNLRPGDRVVISSTIACGYSDRLLRGGHGRHPPGTHCRRVRLRTGRPIRHRQAMNKNLTIRMGNCNHRKYIPRLLECVRTGARVPAPERLRRRSFHHPHFLGRHS